MNINVDLSEKNLIYILNSLNFLMRCMEYHYQINDVKKEVEHFFNYNNYYEDYNNIKFLHRFLSAKGNSDIYKIKNNVFFKGQSDYLITKEKDFEILKIKSRYKLINNKNEDKETKIYIKNSFFINFLLTKVKK